MAVDTARMTAAEERAALWTERALATVTSDRKLELSHVNVLQQDDLLAFGYALGQIIRRASRSMSLVAIVEDELSGKERGFGALARSRGFASARALVADQTGNTNADAQRLIEAGRVLLEVQRAAERAAAALETAAEDAGMEPGGAGDDAPETSDMPSPGSSEPDAADGDGLLLVPDQASGAAPATTVAPSPSDDEPVFPIVAAAIDDASLASPAAYAITRMLRRVWPYCDRERSRKAEQALVACASRLTYDSLVKAVLRWESDLDPSHAEERAEAQRMRRYCIIKEEHDGMFHFDARLDPESGLAMKAVLDAMVDQHFRTKRDTEELARQGVAVTVDKRSPGQVRADSLGDFARHLQGCDVDVLPHHQAKIVVRVDFDPLKQALVNAGLVDGADGTLDPATCRRMAARAGIIPAILGGEKETLDLGTARYFSHIQKLALAERDRGCAKCGAPPSWCDAHHIIPWSEGGKTSLSNGVLLCVRCHHDVHHQGWVIIATRSTVTFIPPKSIDPHQRPRPGARALYELPNNPMAALRPSTTDADRTGHAPGDATPVAFPHSDDDGRTPPGDTSLACRIESDPSRSLASDDTQTRPEHAPRRKRVPEARFHPRVDSSPPWHSSRPRRRRHGIAPTPPLARPPRPRPPRHTVAAVPRICARRRPHSLVVTRATWTMPVWRMTRGGATPRGP
ncbi:HNH endonuclease signature motif containing protein [Demequina sp. NBRC 110055]|uniref:HNH endonuclease n=1 Tax=Demequina sp. NBRC 110055 TaxID=1570344 RepID=UPI0009FE4813|nr:HNH endonuclease signature motif containing protein [Demequina sp. NBRC 110055]